MPTFYGGKGEIAGLLVVSDGPRGFADVVMNALTRMLVEQ
jgi:hypothetical protein